MSVACYVSRLGSGVPLAGGAKRTAKILPASSFYSMAGFRQALTKLLVLPVYMLQQCACGSLL